jgi:hypothetical protein
MHRKGHTTRRRKMKGGYYGAAGPIPGTTGAMQWNKGLEVEPPAHVKTGGRRRKSSKKSSKRTRKMRGGGKFGGVSASFQGEGVRGLANHVPVSVRTPVGSAAGGSFNNFMAKPGSSFGI